MRVSGKAARADSRSGASSNFVLDSRPTAGVWYGIDYLAGGSYNQVMTF